MMASMATAQTTLSSKSRVQMIQKDGTMTQTCATVSMATVAILWFYALLDSNSIHLRNAHVSQMLTLSKSSIQSVEVTVGAKMAATMTVTPTTAATADAMEMTAIPTSVERMISQSLTTQAQLPAKHKTLQARHSSLTPGIKLHAPASFRTMSISLQATAYLKMPPLQLKIHLIVINA